MSERDPRKDFFARSEMASHFFGLWLLPVAGVFFLLMASIPSCRFQNKTHEVILYAAQDQVYAEPILRDFEKQAGIKVRAIYDSEANKTVAIANRLIAERARPQCDVFWGNEELRTRQLAAMNVFRETNGWTAFGHRSRRIAVATSLEAARRPASLLALTNIEWRGRIALAYPLFGSTATHMLALRQHWGTNVWENWCRALAENKPFLVEGNSAAARAVAEGRATIALTDSDDIVAVNRDGVRLTALPITDETLLLPNTVAVIRGAPHPEAAQQLFEFLQSAAVIKRLIEAGALEGDSATSSRPQSLQPDWPALLRDLDTGTRELQRLFAR